MSLKFTLEIYNFGIRKKAKDAAMKEKKSEIKNIRIDCLRNFVKTYKKMVNISFI